jgi:chloramphenicol 3-O phosphotransferase
LLLDFESPWFHMGVDMFGAMRAQDQTHRLIQMANVVFCAVPVLVFIAIVGTPLAGNDIVMDNVLSEPWRLADLLIVTRGIDVAFVGVHCRAVELQRREAARGDRAVGTEAHQFGQVHAHSVYDIEIDTSADSVAHCTSRIRQYLSQHPPSGTRALPTASPTEKCVDLAGASSEDVGHEFLFTTGVGLAVALMVLGKFMFESTVGVSELGVVSQGVAEGQLLMPTGAVHGHEVQVSYASVVDDFD